MSAVLWGEFPETRADNLRFLDDTHVSEVDAATRLGITTDHLEKWCRDHGMHDLWLRMSARNPTPIGAPE